MIRKSIVGSDNKYEYLPIKRDLNIDIEKMKKNEYILKDLVEYTNSCLGQYMDQDIFLKTGKFGDYVEWGENKQSIKQINKPIGEITLQDFIEFMDKKNDMDNGKESSGEKSGILRILNNSMSIRSGKFGPYVFYKTIEMKKPMILNIKKFKWRSPKAKWH